MVEDFKRYYCTICKKTITKSMFQYSMNKFKKPLCSDHQNKDKITNVKNGTKKLQDLVRKRHSEKMNINKLHLKSIKDWIEADLDNWADELNKNKTKGYTINTNTVKK